jgi:hypothetical protein
MARELRTARKGRNDREESSEKKSTRRKSSLMEEEGIGDITPLLELIAEMEKEGFDYDADMEIDPRFLDAEWLDQGRRYMKYVKASSMANRRKALAEERVKTLRSELVNEAKGTEAGKNASTLEAYYRTNDDYIAAKKAFIDASLVSDLLSGAVFGFQMRKAQLENLLRMTLSEYYSAPNVPNDLPDAAEKFKELRQKSARSDIKDRMNRRSR